MPLDHAACLRAPRQLDGQCRNRQFAQRDVEAQHARFVAGEFGASEAGIRCRVKARLVQPKICGRDRHVRRFGETPLAKRFTPDDKVTEQAGPALVAQAA